MGAASINSDYEVRIKPFRGDFMISPAQFHHDHHNHIEMITFEATPYTSLKDLLETSPPSSASPSSWLIMSSCSSGCRKDSWREIPIKDPLLQHAAWAYLLPMSGADSPGGTHTRNFLHKLKNLLCGGRGIFGCLNDVVMVITKNWVSVFSR